MKFNHLLLPFLAFLSFPLPSFAASPKPRIAVVIDDFGLTYPKNVPDEKWMQITWPVTFAVMPRSKRTRQAAQEAAKAGKEVLIHFPFDPFLKLDLPKGGTRSEKDEREVLRLLEEAIRDIPGAVGVNNHRSPKAMVHKPMMQFFMAELKKRNLFFLDSLISAKTVGYQEARKAGIRTAINDVFLDTVRRRDKEFCKKMLRRVAGIAKRRGWAICIGHHYFQGTYEGLVEAVPELQKQGFEFVFVSQLVR